jgi:dTDP-4-dehydrorhamnose reductase
MTRLLITGASGLLGANLVLETESRFDVTAVVYTQSVDFKHARVIRADLTDANSVLNILKDCHPQWTIHCAADTAIDNLESDPDRAHLVNVQMASNVARNTASVRSRLLFVSTDSVFDGRQGPYTELDDPNPLNTYARSKLAGERAVADEHPGAVIVRTNLFGWSPAQKKSLAEWFFLKLMEGDHCMGFADIYFSPVYAPELASIFVQMLDQNLEGLYHIPGDECISKYEFGRRLASVFGLDTSLIHSTPSTNFHGTAERPKKTCLNGSKIERTLGITLPNLEEGLKRFRADYEGGLFQSLRISSKLEEHDA